MGRIFSFSTGLVLGFAAGIFIDNKKRKKIQEIAKSQIDRIKSYENTLTSNINKMKGIAQNKKVIRTIKK